MLLKFLGIMDLISAIVLGLVLFEILPQKYILIFGIYLAIKSVIFLLGKDFASMIDFVIAIVFILISFNIKLHLVISLISGFWLVQKAFFSFFASEG